MEVLKNKLSVVGWALSALVSLLAFIAWGQGLEWDFDNFSSYKLFPLFGLLAFSLMLVHYVVAVKRKYLGIPASETKSYFEYSSLLVLAAFLAHPSLLIVQLWLDGFGPPPASYLENYVASSAKGAAFLGSLSFFIFLSYELRRKFKKRTWWKYVQYASDAAMVMIFFHALRLGGELQEGWYRSVWYIYGLIYVVSIIYLYAIKKKENKV